jgi:hypothetical protein
MFKKNKTEAIPIREFLRDGHPNYRREMPRTNNIYAFSAFFPTITPQGLFPLHDPAFALFVCVSGAVVVSAFFERFFIRSGSSYIAEMISMTTGFIFPAIVYGAVFWFLFSL